MKGAYGSMKILSKMMRFFTAATIAMSCMFTMPTAYTAYAEEGRCGTSTNWTLSNGTLTISGSGAVTAAGWTQYSDKITNVVVEDGVTTITASAFKDHTSLQSVRLADSVTAVGASAFSGCSSLESVDLSDSMVNINATVFRLCVNLKQITLPKNLQLIKESAFYGCLKLESIELPSTVTSIGDYAFGGTGLQSVTLNDGLQTIGTKAFDISCFPIINIPDSVTSIGSQAFGQVYTNVMYMNGLIYGGYAGNKTFVTIYGKAGSAAEQFAASAGLEFHEGIYVAHTCSGQWLIEKIATCQSEGQRYYICNTCGKKYTETIPIGDHIMGSWKVTKPATCTADGTETSTCQYCTKSESRTIPATGHSFGAWEVTKEATCTADGVETQTCSGCKQSNTRTIPATGHSYGAWVVTKEATCTVDGVETQTCGGCGDKKTRSITAPGHNYGDWSLVKDPTFTEEGLEEQICSGCKQKQTRSIPKLEGYTISASCGYGGSISPSGDQIYAVSSSVTYTFTPIDGYEISDVIVNNQSVGKQTSYTFYNLLKDQTIRVEFEKIPPVPTCSIITVTSTKAYWEPTDSSFSMSDFTITAKIVAGDEVMMVNITDQCKPVDTPKTMFQKGKYGSVQLSFQYTGDKAAIVEYLKTNTISSFVTVAMKGDGNMDQIIDADDSCMALTAYVVSLTQGRCDLTDTEFALLNIIKDGRMDADDATAILRYYVDSLTGGGRWED